MRLLITITDIRKQRQLGKQLNDDNFEARVLEIQLNELTELLNPALTYDLFDFLDNGFTNQPGTYTRTSDKVFKAVSQDLTVWIGYSLRINNTEFGIIKTAVLNGADTDITLTDESETLPDSISTIDYSTETKYINLLNGADYELYGNTIRYFGLRAFIGWKLLATFVLDGSIKHSDVGNFSIKSMNFDIPNTGDKYAAKSIYLQNSTREENKIINYLNENSTLFPLWNCKNDENIQSYSINVI